MPEGIEDRNADVWEALLAIADLAGADWPERARVAAVSLVTDSSDRAGSLGVLLLRDLRTVFKNADRLPTEVILERLTQLEESPWGDLRGKPLDARGLARRLSKYGQIKPGVYRDGAGTVRGYLAADLLDAWQRYLPQPEECVTAVTSGTAMAPVEPPDDCGHGVPEGDQPDPFVGGLLRCTQCRAAALIVRSA